MAETKTNMRTTLVGWIVAGWLLTVVVAILLVLTDPITVLVIALGFGLGIGIAFIIIMNETLILTTIRALQNTGENIVRLISLRKNMRSILAIWIFALFTFVVVMTAFNQLELDKFGAIMGVLGSFVASVVAYYFAASRNEPA